MNDALFQAISEATVYQGFIGALIGGIASVAGAALSSRRSRETTTTQNQVDYGAMAKAAKKAGFNPLTAIRNGGSAGFSTTTTTSPTASQLPGALSSLGGTLGQAFGDAIDPVKQKQRQLDTALVDYQLRQLKEGPKAMPGRLYPGGQTLGVKVERGRPAMTQTAAAKVAADPEPIPLWVRARDRDGTIVWVPNPDGPDAEQWATPPLANAQSGWESETPNGAKQTPWIREKAAAFRRGYDQLQTPTVRKLTTSEKQKRDEGWGSYIPEWVPRFSWR